MERKTPNNIRYLRKLKGWTMKELGEKVEVAESTISQYETGKRQPDNEMLLRLGEVLNCSVDFLLSTTSATEQQIFADASIAKYLDRLRNDPRARVLLDVSEKMTESEISQVEAFARFLRSNDK